MKKIVYIGGVRGVGKSTLLAGIEKRIGNIIDYCNFSKVLGEEYDRLTGSDQFHGYEHTDDYLRAVDAAVDSLLPRQPIVITGHYFFHTIHGKRVYLDPFERISPCVAFIHLVCEPSHLFNRLSMLGIDSSLEDIRQDMEYSGQVAEDLSHKLETPLLVLSQNGFMDDYGDKEANVEILIKYFMEAKLI